LTGLRADVEDFYFYEAELLDDRRLHEWVALFTDDAHYWMPARQNTLNSDVPGEFSKLGDMAFFDDTKQILQMRVERLDTGTAWAETPPSRTRHLISNVRASELENKEIEARSNFVVYRSRLETTEDFFVGTREDILRREEGQLRIAKRTVLLDHVVVMARNISIFL
jgi:biphenyl 2,3-dioxygenase beta subunit